MTLDFDIEKQECTTEKCLERALEHFFRDWFPMEKKGSYRTGVALIHSPEAVKFQHNKELLFKIFGWIISAQPMGESPQILWNQVDQKVVGVNFRQEFSDFMRHLRDMGLLPADMNERFERLGS